MAASEAGVQAGSEQVESGNSKLPLPLLGAQSLQTL